MKMLKKCPLCGEPIDPNTDILCANCGNILTKDDSYEEDEPKNTHALPDGTILNKRYQIKRFLNQGGFGITYEGLDNLLHARIAIKEYYPRSLAERHTSVSLNVNITLREDAANYRTGLENFLKEARNLAQFAGEENIVHVSDYFEEHNTAYIVMEYVDGITVEDYVKQNGKISFSKCMEITKPVMKALEAVHGQNMVHRDISPTNIMIRKNGGVKLLDFGAARIVDSVSKSLSVIIRPGYTPIEQYSSNRPQGPYTDIFALCGTMYYMLTGIAPENLYERMAKKAQLKRPSELGADISPQQELAVIKGLAIDPEDRFQTIGELRDALLGTKVISKAVKIEMPEDREEKAAAAETAVPEAAAPGAAAREVDVPEADAPGAAAPEIAASEADAHETAAPYRSLRILLVIIDVLLIIGIVFLLRRHFATILVPLIGLFIIIGGIVFVFSSLTG